MTTNSPPFRAGPASHRARPARYATMAALLTLALGLTATIAASRVRQNVREEEKKRIARELHDDRGQQPRRSA